jgi:nitrite reductase/ring-hydroxylating ferredoxin subunit
MAFIKVASLSNLPPGSVTEVRLGETPYAICNHNGEVHALWGTCPHAYGPVGQGTMNGQFVVCPYHEWAYDCQTGANDYDSTIQLARFAVKVEGNDILMDPDRRA